MVTLCLECFKIIPNNASACCGIYKTQGLSISSGHKIHPAIMKMKEKYIERLKKVHLLKDKYVMKSFEFEGKLSIAETKNDEIERSNKLLRQAFVSVESLSQSREHQSRQLLKKVINERDDRDIELRTKKSRIAELEMVVSQLERESEHAPVQGDAGHNDRIIAISSGENKQIIAVSSFKAATAQTLIRWACGFAIIYSIVSNL